MPADPLIVRTVALPIAIAVWNDRSSRPIPHARKDGSTLMDKMELQ